MAKKNTIRFEADFEGALFAIVTQLKDYRLCWHINKEAGFNLKKINDIEIIHKKKNKTAMFSLFRQDDEINKWLVHLVSNKHLGEYLIPEVKQTDFLLVINGELDEGKNLEILASLKNISGVQLAITLDYSSLKSKENLVFE